MSYSEITVRIAVLEDALAIGNVHAESFQRGYVGLVSDEALGAIVDRNRKRWVAMMTSPIFEKTTALVAEEGGGIIGFLTFAPLEGEPQTGQIFTFYVHPDAWGTGAAQALMNQALRLSVDRGISLVQLWTHPGAERARRFDEKAGFVTTGNPKEESPPWAGGVAIPEIEYVRDVAIDDS